MQNSKIGKKIEDKGEILIKIQPFNPFNHLTISFLNFIGGMPNLSLYKS